MRPTQLGFSQPKVLLVQSCHRVGSHADSFLVDGSDKSARAQQQQHDCADDTHVDHAALDQRTETGVISQHEA